MIALLAVLGLCWAAKWLWGLTAPDAPAMATTVRGHLVVRIGPKFPRDSRGLWVVAGARVDGHPIPPRPKNASMN